MTIEPLDVVAVGAGPFNLSLAALADRVPGLRLAVLEQRPEFRWHPGLLIEGVTLQVPFLADLVTLVDPTNRWSFLNFLAGRGRLFPFYFAERFHVPRAEYDAYCRWVATGLGTVRFDHRVCSIHWDGAAFIVRHDGHDGHDNGAVRARNVVLGVGTEPVLPAPLRRLAELPGALVLHSADYLRHRDELLGAGEVTVVGSGQSGAEVFHDLLRRRPPGAERLHWLARTPAFAPMEYSKLGLEQFTPDYTAFFHALPEPVRDRLVPAQWQLYKGVDAGTLAGIHDELYERSLGGGWPDVTLRPGVEVVDARAGAGGRIELGVRHVQQGTTATVRTDAVVAATGYAERCLDELLAPLAGRLRTDASGRPSVSLDYRLDLGADVHGSVFVQNSERHSHGVGAPDLGLAAWRAAVILNAVCGRPVFALPERTAFTTFGLKGAP
jgi:lysine N6-hydroxylase